MLGLMKAQNVKNTMIVPVGAKGGFVPQQLPQNAGREAVMEEVSYCYICFINGLLDITDNFPPQAVAAHQVLEFLLQRCREII